MEDGRMFGWLMSQIWQVPFLLLFLFGLVMSLSGKYKGQFVGLAAAGFGVLIFGIVLSGYQQYAMFAAMADGGYDTVRRLNTVLSAFGVVVRLAGYILLLAAIFSGRHEKPARNSGYQARQETPPA